MPANGTTIIKTDDSPLDYSHPTTHKALDRLYRALGVTDDTVRYSNTRLFDHRKG